MRNVIGFLIFSVVFNLSASQIDNINEKFFTEILKSYTSKPKKKKKKDEKIELPYSSSEYFLGLQYSGAIALGIFYEKHKDIFADRNELFQKYIKYSFVDTANEHDVFSLKEAMRYGQLVQKYRSNKILLKKKEPLIKKIYLIEEFPKPEELAVIQQDSVSTPAKEVANSINSEASDFIKKFLLKENEDIFIHKKTFKPQTMAEVRGMESDALSRLTESAMPEIQDDIFSAISPVIDVCRSYIDEEDPLLDFFNFLTNVSESKKLNEEKQYCLALVSVWMNEKNVTAELRQKAETDLMQISILPGAGSMFVADRESIGNSVDELYTFALATYGNNIRLGMDMFNKIREKREGALVLRNGALSALTTITSNMLAAISKDNDVVFMELSDQLLDMGFSSISTIQEEKWQKLQKLIVRKDSNLQEALDASASLFDMRLKDDHKYQNLTSLVAKSVAYSVKGIELGKTKIEDLYVAFNKSLKFLSFLNMIGFEDVKDSNYIEKISITIPHSTRKCLKVRNRRGRVFCKY